MYGSPNITKRCSMSKTYGSIVSEDYRPRSHSEPIIQTNVRLANVKGKNALVGGNEIQITESEERADRSGPARERSRSHSRLRFIEPQKPQGGNKHHESDYLKSKLWCVYMRLHGSRAYADYGRQVAGFLVDEYRRDGQLCIICICSSVCSCSTWDSECAYLFRVHTTDDTSAL